MLRVTNDDVIPYLLPANWYIGCHINQHIQGTWRDTWQTRLGEHTILYSFPIFKCLAINQIKTARATRINMCLCLRHNAAKKTIKRIPFVPFDKIYDIPRGVDTRRALAWRLTGNARESTTATFSLVGIEVVMQINEVTCSQCRSMAIW